MLLYDCEFHCQYKRKRMVVRVSNQILYPFINNPNMQEVT